jgi:hypothetical protein
MNEPVDLELLQDLAKLLRKHGPDAFEQLARRLENPEFINQLCIILSAGARAAREVGIAKRSTPHKTHSPQDYRHSLLDQERLGPEKSALLVRLYDDLMAKTLLPTMQELRAFAVHSSLPPPTASVRHKAVVALLEALRERSLEELRQIVSHLPPPGGSNDRSLEHWAHIIFDKELRSKKAE